MRVSDRVTWPVAWDRKRGMLRRLGSVLADADTSALTAETGLSTSSDRVSVGVADDVALPDDPAAEVPLERIVAERADGVLREVQLSQLGVRVEGGDDLDLTRAVVVSVEAREDKNLHRPTAHWEFVVEVDGERVALYGPWVSFAWLGYLAGWPVPQGAESTA